MTFGWSSWGFGETKGLKNRLFWPKVSFKLFQPTKMYRKLSTSLGSSRLLDAQTVRDMAKNTDCVTTEICVCAELRARRSVSFPEPARDRETAEMRNVFQLRVVYALFSPLFNYEHDLTQGKMVS